MKKNKPEAKKQLLILPSYKILTPGKDRDPLIMRVKRISAVELRRKSPQYRKHSDIRNNNFYRIFIRKEELCPELQAKSSDTQKSVSAKTRDPSRVRHEIFVRCMEWNLTVKTLAKESGINRNTLYKYLNAERVWPEGAEKAAYDALVRLIEKNDHKKGPERGTEWQIRDYSNHSRRLSSARENFVNMMKSLPSRPVRRTAQ